MSVPGGEVEVTCGAVQAMRDAGRSFCLLDCREQNEYDLVRIDGARLLPMSEIASRVGELDSVREQEVIVYCHHGMRSLQVAMWLRQQGYAGAKSMAGGIDLWAQEIEPGMRRY